MSWFLSIEMTRRCSLISLTVVVLGTSTSMPDCRMGAVIMKIMRSTRTTSMNGTMLISESVLCVVLESCGIGLGSRKSKVESRKFRHNGNYAVRKVNAQKEILFALGGMRFGS